MKRTTLINNLRVPDHCVDAVLDTDAYNEIDDQYAIAYMLRSKERINTLAIYAAPFKNRKAASAGEGMLKSYDEIGKILSLMDESVPYLKGSDSFLKDESTPVISDAARDLVRRAKEYSPENPLYVIAIGAITNVASAMLLDDCVKENCVVIWLGGHARHYHDTKEFNLRGDVAAARVVMGSGVPFVQLPCQGVVNAFRISGPELEYWFRGRGPLADYLADNTIAEAESLHSGEPWTRCIWDVTAVAYLLNDGDRFMCTTLAPAMLPTYDYEYEPAKGVPDQAYIYFIKRDELFKDMVKRLTLAD